MFFYEVGYSSYEDSGKATLMHKRSFREHEFNKMVFECSMEASREFFAEEQAQNASLREDIEFNRLYRCDDRCIYISFDRIYQRIAEIMCEKYGFVQPQIKYKFIPFGWDDLRKKNDWREVKKSRLQKKISRALIEEFGESEDSSIIRNEYQENS